METSQSTRVERSSAGAIHVPTVLPDFLAPAQFAALRTQAPDEYFPSVVINDQNQAVESHSRTSMQRHLQQDIGSDLARRLSRHVGTPPRLRIAVPL